MRARARSFQPRELQLWENQVCLEAGGREWLLRRNLWLSPRTNCVVLPQLAILLRLKVAPIVNHLSNALRGFVEALPSSRHRLIFRRAASTFVCRASQETGMVFLAG